MTQSQLALLADTRVPDSARILALFVDVATKADDGFAEISHDEFRRILFGGPSDDTIRRHLRQLENTGWIESRPGGKGHSNRYRILATDECGPNQHFRAALVRSLKDRLGTEQGLSTFSSAPEPSLKPPVVVGGSSKKEVEETRGRALQVSYPLTEQARTAIDERGDSLTGCRGALQDYLESRVPEGRQYGFVQTVVTWIDGRDRSVFELSDGSKLPDAEKTGYIAAALNELSAGDESRMKRPVGDPGNLKTKLNILLRQRGYDGGRNGSTHRGGRPGETRREATVAHNPIIGERDPDTRFD